MDLGLDLTVINTFWRQIARLRTRTHTRNAGDIDNIHAGTTRDNLSYTAEEEARNEPTKGGNKTDDVVVWIYWRHEAGTRTATAKEVKTWRKRCKGYGGMTINGDELFVCERTLIEDIRKSELMTLICFYDLKLFDL